jgi:hypothetical protein
MGVIETLVVRLAGDPAQIRSDMGPALVAVASMERTLEPKSDTLNRADADVSGRFYLKQFGPLVACYGHCQCSLERRGRSRPITQSDKKLEGLRGRKF